jgi:Concanavalin A-like lectin/glucanases superfamily
VALTDSLDGHYALDEASGTRLDSTANSYDLTESGGTTSSTTGKISSAAVFTAVSDRFLVASASSIYQYADTDFTIQAWVNLTTKSATQRIITKFGASHGEYQLRYNSGADTFEFYVWGTSGYGSQGLVSTSSGISTGTWYHLICHHDATANEIAITTNAGTPVTTSHSTGTYTSTDLLRLGDSNDYNEPPDLALDEVGFWSRVLTSGERTSLYNGGSGFAYPFSGGASLVVTPFRNRVMSPGHIFGGKCLC